MSGRVVMLAKALGQLVALVVMTAWSIALAALLLVGPFVGLVELLDWFSR